MSVRDELISLHKGQSHLRVEPVIEWAQKHPASELHRNLEWDDGVAGHLYRCQQVRRLIAIHVVSETGVRELVSLHIDRQRGGGYRSLTAVMRAPDLRRMLLDEALAELERVRLKYAALVELADVWDRIEQAQAARVRQQHRRHRRKEARAA